MHAHQRSGHPATGCWGSAAASSTYPGRARRSRRPEPDDPPAPGEWAGRPGGNHGGNARGGGERGGAGGERALTSTTKVAVVKAAVQHTQRKTTESTHPASYMARGSARAPVPAGSGGPWALGGPLGRRRMREADVLLGRWGPAFSERLCAPTMRLKMKMKPETVPYSEPIAVSPPPPFPIVARGLEHDPPRRRFRKSNPTPSAGSLMRQPQL